VLIVRQLTTIVLGVVAVGTPLVILVKSALDFRRAEQGRGSIFLRGVGALAIWLVVSLGMMFMLFVTFFSSAHSEYRLSHGGAPDLSGSDDPTGMILMLVVIYALAGGGLSYWMLRPART
jgi:hypothetical protein